MADATEPQTWLHEDDGTPSAPGDLELVRSFLSLHEHAAGRANSQPPTRGSMRWWLEHNGLVVGGDGVADEHLDRALEVLEALRAQVDREGQALDSRLAETLDEAAVEAGLRLRFSDAPGPERVSGIEPTAPGVVGAIGRLLAIAFVAEIDGRWSRFKHCGSRECRSVFYDRSKNHSGRWCSMQTCGNRNKVRAWRDRQDRA
jgi:CGNR zinc finger